MYASRLYDFGGEGHRNYSRQAHSVGMKNLRMLKILVPLSGVVFVLYILNGYRQASNDVSLQKRFLKESEEEFKTLAKRFDMLSMELKSK